MAWKKHEFTLKTEYSTDGGEHVTNHVTFAGNTKQMLKYLKKVIKEAEESE